MTINDSLRAEVLPRARVLLAVARPPVLALLALYAVTGYAIAGGDPQEPLRLLPALLVVAGFLIFSVSLNDLSDVEIDRVNLANRHDRPLVTGAAGRRELGITAAVGGLVALTAAAVVGRPALAVCTGGLLVSAAYSLRPFRLAGRGAIASLVLPAGYVAVPYLCGVLTVSRGIDWSALLLMAGLYVGFIGRILLKDFRDVRGDALFGKRTFLVRHGRRATCVFSAVGWSAGTALTVVATMVAGRSSSTLDLTYGAALLGVLVLLRALAADRGPCRDELLVAAVAVVGRGQLLALLIALSMIKRPELQVSAAIAAVALVSAGQAVQLLRRGPVLRHVVPAAWLTKPATLSHQSAPVNTNVASVTFSAACDASCASG